MKLTALICLSALMIAGTVHPASAGKYSGSIGIERPLGDPDRPQDESSMVVGKLTLPKVVGNAGLFFAGQINLHNGMPFSKENKAIAEIECPLGRGFTAYTFYERRWNYISTRFVAGLRWSFAGRY